jgi:hypothetical protein
MGMKPELFIIDEEAVGATNLDDVLRTFYEMASIGIASPPVDHLVIGFDPRIFISGFYPEDGDKEIDKSVIKVVTDNPNAFLAVDIIHSLANDGKEEPDGRKKLCWLKLRKSWINRKTLKYISDYQPVFEDEQYTFEAMFQTLIVLLATKNAQKDRVHNRSTSASSKTRNASKNFAYTTTIRIGKITENCKSGGTGSPMRPHLRRGHVRNQRYGEGRREIKQIFIAPVFINADKEYVESQRIAYKIRA